MPTYRIDRPGMDLPRVVVAAQPQAARMHVANDELTVRRIEVDEAFELANQGVMLERAGEEAPQQQPEAETDLGTAAEDDAKSDLDHDRLREDRDERRQQEQQEPFDAGDEELAGN